MRGHPANACHPHKPCIQPPSHQRLQAFQPWAPHKTRRCPHVRADAPVTSSRCSACLLPRAHRPEKTPPQPHPSICPRPSFPYFTTTTPTMPSRTPVAAPHLHPEQLLYRSPVVAPQEQHDRRLKQRLQLVSLLCCRLLQYCRKGLLDRCTGGLAGLRGWKEEGGERREGMIKVMGREWGAIKGLGGGTGPYSREGRWTRRGVAGAGGDGKTGWAEQRRWQ